LVKKYWAIGNFGGGQRCESPMVHLFQAIRVGFNRVLAVATGQSLWAKTDDEKIPARAIND